MYLPVDKECPNEICGGAHLQQEVDLKVTIDSHTILELIGDPFCDECSPQLVNKDLAYSPCILDLIGEGEREMLIFEAIKFLTEDEDRLHDCIEKATEKFYADKKKKRATKLKELFKDPHVLDVALQEW